MPTAEIVGYFEPLERDRVWYRNKQTSDRGYMVERDGRKAVRYDRPAVDQYTFNVGEWEPILENLPDLSPAHVAQVCFEADKALCRALGHFDLADRKWVDLHENMRAKWIESGPLKKSPSFRERMKLYLAIRAVLA